MRATRALATLLAVAGVPGLAVTTYAQLARQGSYAGTYEWVVSSTVHELEEGHVFTQDVYKGTFYNDAGDGFLHGSSWVCPGITDLVDGKGVSRGYCIVTDKDDDKVFNVWEGTVDPKAGFEAHFEWTGGTGKYLGIQGKNTFRATAVMLTSEGPPLGIATMKLSRPSRPTRRVRAEGEWRLP